MGFKLKKNETVYFFDEGRFIKARVDICMPKAVRVEGINIKAAFMFGSGYTLFKHPWMAKIHEIMRIIKA